MCVRGKWLSRIDREVESAGTNLIYWRCSVANKIKSIMMTLQRNISVILHVFKHLTDFGDKLKSLWILFIFLITIGLIYLRVKKLVTPLANAWFFYPLQVIGWIFTFYGLKKRFRPSEVSNVIEDYDLSLKPFVEIKNSEFPNLKGFPSHQLNTEANLQDKYLYISVSAENDIPNISAYDIKLSEYLSRNQDIKLATTPLRGEHEIYKDLGSQISSIC